MWTSVCTNYRQVHLLSGQDKVLFQMENSIGSFLAMTITNNQISGCWRRGVSCTKVTFFVQVKREGQQVLAQNIAEATAERTGHWRRLLVGLGMVLHWVEV